MPTQPPLDGLPVWAQIIISILICVATLAVSFKGYFGRRDGAAGQVSAANSTTTTALAAASIVDSGPFRHLADTVVHLNASVVALTNAINEGTHYSRNEVEAQRELCARLRALCEELERQARNGRGLGQR